MIAKRAWDILAALAGLLLLWPAMLLVALLIVVTDGRPVLFRQKRVGIHGTDFMLLKFRSMTPSKEAENGSFEAGSQSRVTSVGRLLRRTKIDELPQLWNVLLGSMSLVGPRPEVRKWVQVYPERWEIVLTVRPGITDPASIVYRDEEELLAKSSSPETTYRDIILPHKLDLYEAYVLRRTFWGDISILARTFLAVVRRGR